jgi:hypothetical protein
MWICSTYLMYTPVWRLVFELGAGTSSIALGHASCLPLPPPPTWRSFPLLQQLIICMPGGALFI